MILHLFSCLPVASLFLYLAYQLSLGTWILYIFLDASNFQSIALILQRQQNFPDKIYHPLSTTFLAISSSKKQKMNWALSLLEKLFLKYCWNCRTFFKKKKSRCVFHTLEDYVGFFSLWKKVCYRMVFFFILQFFYSWLFNIINKTHHLLFRKMYFLYPFGFMKKFKYAWKEALGMHAIMVFGFWRNNAPIDRAYLFILLLF